LFCKSNAINNQETNELPDGEEIMPLAFFVLTQYRRVTDGRTDGRTDRQTRCDRYYPR